MRQSLSLSVNWGSLSAMKSKCLLTPGWGTESWVSPQLSRKHWMIVCMLLYISNNSLSYVKCCFLKLYNIEFWCLCVFQFFIQGTYMYNSFLFVLQFWRWPLLPMQISSFQPTVSWNLKFEYCTVIQIEQFVMPLIWYFSPWATSKTLVSRCHL